MKKIGFIGIGVMGGPIVNHILNAGYEVFGYSRTKIKVQEQITNGMNWCDTTSDVVKNTDIIFTMVGFPADVEEVYLDSDGLLANSTPNQIFIDLTTSQPTLAKKIAQIATEKSAFALDAPVTGGDVGAKNGTLAMMVGGDKNAFEIVKPILELFTNKIFYFGSAGNGQHAKMANQTVIASNLVGMAEGLAYAETAGLDMESMLEILCNGAAGSWQLTNNGPKALVDDFNPGFFSKHFLKDMKIALSEAETLGLKLPSLKTTASSFEEIVADGDGDLGTQVIYKKYKK
jgi:3-hydroxyisobutyrate dehydrogenase and related beta-hydroxyacid dehydrogenases